MLLRWAPACVLGISIVVVACVPASSQSSGLLTLTRALQRAAATNPRLTAADRDIGIASGRRIQAGAIPNPQASFELDNAAGSGAYRGLRSAETTLQLSQLIELGGKREARVAAGVAEVDAAYWQRAAVKLEIISETAIAFFNTLAAQRRIAILDNYIAGLQRLTPLLQKRVEAGASSPAEVARAELASDLVRADRERARAALAVFRLELATLMGAQGPDFSAVTGDLARVGRAPAFTTLRRAVEANPVLARYSALRAQRDAELLIARLKPIPDPQVSAGWRHYRDTNDNAVRVGVSIPIPVWDQNLGNIAEARATRQKVDAEFAGARATLMLTLGRAYETLNGSTRELEILRSAALPRARRALEGMESGYAQGRFTLLELLDVQNGLAQAALRELEAMLSFHTSLATIEGLTGAPFRLTESPR